MIKCDEIEKYTVKITYERQGSGIIFLPNENSEYCYILTARHNFKDKNKNLIPINELDIKEVKVEYREFDDLPFEQITCKEVIYHTKHDLAIIIAYSDEAKSVISNLSQLAILEIDDFSKCIFKGYPRISESSSTCLDAQYKERAKSTTFKIKSDDLASFDNSEIYNTKGFSGSGVLTPFNNEPFLVGLIIEAKNAFNELNCLDFRHININTILENSSYPLIEIEKKEIIELEEDEKLDFLKQIRTKLSSEESNQLEQLLHKKQKISSNKTLGFISTSHTPVTDDINILNKEIVKYLENGNILEAKKVIKDIVEPNGETYRLCSLIALYEKDLNGANNFINKAKEKEVNIKDLEFTQGLIYYFSSILDEGYSSLTPYPVDRIFIKNDKTSLENIKKAQVIFYNLSKNNENIDLETWYLASLHLVNLEETKDKSKEFIEKSPNHYGAITYISAYNFDIDLTNSINFIKEIKNKTFENIIDLYNCYMHKKDYKLAVELIKSNQDKYKSKVLLERSYLNTYMAQSLYDKALFLSKNSQNIEIRKLEQSIIIEKLHFNKEWDKLIKIYEKDITSFGLFNLCKIKANLNDWEFIASKCDILIKDSHNKKVYDLAITALYNNKEYEKALELIEKYNKLFGDLDKKIKNIKSSSLNKIGETSKSISVIESIIKKDVNDIQNLLYQYNKTGSLDKIETLAHDIIKNKKSPNELKIATANLVKNKNRTLAQKLISEINVKDIPNEQISNLAHLSLELGEEKLQKVLIPKWTKLIEKDKKFGISFNNVEDVISFIKEEEKISSEVFIKYKYNQISFHFLRNSKIYFDKLNNEFNSQIFIRAGNKTQIEIINKDIKNIYLDASSIFILHYLNLLNLLIENYEVYIPPYFIQMITNGTYEYEQTSKELVQLLNIHIKNEKIKFTQELEEDDFEKEDISNPAFLNILSIVKTKMKDKSIALVDDRFFNNYKTFETTLIYGVSDLLKTFKKNKLITEEIYYKKILELRKKKLLYIPFENKEFLYHLYNAHITNNKITETEELKTLKEYFNYVYTNLKYLTLQNNEKARIEAHYIGHMHTFIGRIFFQIWEEDKDNWNIYVDYLVENFLILNTAYFVKDTVAYYDDLQFPMLAFSSMLYLSMFHLDETLKEYMERINHRFLEPLVYRDAKLFEDLVSVLKYNLMQEYKGNKEEKKLLHLLHTDFINKLPNKLKNEILKDSEIIKKYKFIETSKIDGKTIDRNVFLKKTSLVLNSNLKEKLTKEFEIFKEKEEVLLKNLSTNTISTVSDEFYIMSSSVDVQKKVLNNNPQWFDTKESEVIRFKKDILSEKDPVKRFFKLEKYRDLSGDTYYSNIYEDLKNSNQIDFTKLIPNKIETITSHFKFTKNENIKSNKKSANKRLLKEEEIEIALERLCSLPQELPTNIYAKLNALTDENKLKILRKFRDVASTPLNRFHFIKIISKCLSEKLARRIIRKSIEKMPEDILLEIRAYLSCYKWFYFKFKYEFKLTNELLIILSFGHSDKIFRNFKAFNINLKQLKNEFEQRTRNYLDEILEEKDINDVLNPFIIDEFNFLFKGLNYALEDKPELIKNDKFLDLVYSNKEKEIPHFELLREQTLLNNCCDSFMGKDYKQFFSYLTNNKKNIYEQGSIKKSVDSIFKDLKEDSSKYYEYSILSVIFDNVPIYEQFKNDFIELIINIDFSEIEDIYKLSILKFASNQNIFLRNNRLEEHLKNAIIDICKKCITKDEFIKYFDILIYLSIGSDRNIENRIKYLKDLLQEVSTKENNEFIKDIVNNMMFQLPIKASNVLINLLVDLRRQ